MLFAQLEDDRTSEANRPAGAWRACYPGFLAQPEQRRLANLQRRVVRTVVALLRGASSRATPGHLSGDDGGSEPAWLCTSGEDIRSFVRARTPWTRRALDALLDAADGASAMPAAAAWSMEDHRLSSAQRERALDDFIELIQGIDAVFVFQVSADARELAAGTARTFGPREITRIERAALVAYRARCIAVPMRDARFASVLRGLLTGRQAARLEAELLPILDSMHGHPS